MFASARKAISVIFDPALAGAALKAVALTACLFVGVLALTEYAIALLPAPPWLDAALALLAPVLFLLLAGLVGAPVAALFAALFLDGLAARIEARDYPHDPPAGAGAFGATLRAGLRLTGLILAADVILFPFDLALPGLGELLSLGVNGWLLGREYFELVALRHHGLAKVDFLRSRNGGRIWGAGALISLLSIVPLVNLVAPLFGTALMVHLFKRVETE